jgi:hypothetical protein
MIIVAFACLVTGALLGSRFRVAVLLPATVVAMAAIVSFGVLNGQKASLIVVSQVIALVALQSGYLSATVLATLLARKPYRPDSVTVRDSP